MREDANLRARESRKPRVTSSSLLTLLVKKSWSGSVLEKQLKIELLLVSNPLSLPQGILF